MLRNYSKAGDIWFWGKYSGYTPLEPFPEACSQPPKTSLGRLKQNWIEWGVLTQLLQKKEQMIPRLHQGPVAD